MLTDQEDFLRYYHGELTYLRRMGANFAERYPKLAGRLELSPNDCADPQIERLLESFAFLTARIQRRLDGEFPEITSALLGVLYPHLVNPIPAMSIAHFSADSKQGKLTTGFEIARHTKLFAQTDEGLNCRFRTCYPVTLWPLEVVSAGFESKAQFDFLDHATDVATVLRLRISAPSAKLAELPIKQLRFYLHGSSILVSTLYEMLFGNVRGVAVLGENGPVFLPNDSIRPVGFGLDEDVIPYPRHSHPGYRLVQEYFALPQKFFFFDLANLERHQGTQELDILFLMDRTPQRGLWVDRNTFMLGCTPIINLFQKTTEPIRLDHREHEYRLVADIRRERTTEIHSIRSVSASSNPAEETAVLQPFYSFHHEGSGKEPRVFWHSRRLPTGRDDLPGTDLFLSFLDLDFRPDLPPTQTVFAHTLCTNRELALELPAGAALQIEEAAPVARIQALLKPTPPAYPPMQGTTLWALISNLSLNHLSLSGGKESLEPLREILRLYSFSDRPSTFQQVNGIVEMECRRVVRRVGGDAWRGFCQGTEVTLTFDENSYMGSGAFLLASVLQRFFSLYASVNSFSQLVIKSMQREGEWKRWPPMAGEQAVL
ncbi:MAG TPA: type VI secretion system baseplate subunit TssF [Candidatus Angelobacter sp.]|nr:type VI secretion system baseplate subunit TssF [Candidatus Angelobacter sp.]